MPADDEPVPQGARKDAPALSAAYFVPSGRAEPAALAAAFAAALADAASPQQAETVDITIAFSSAAEAMEFCTQMQTIGALPPDTPPPAVLVSASRKIVAVHEAGHAVMVAALGRRVRDIVVEHKAPGGWGGCVMHHPRWGRSDRAIAATCAGGIMISLAGAIAEVVFAGVPETVALQMNAGEIDHALDRLRALPYSARRGGDHAATVGAVANLVADTLRANERQLRALRDAMMSMSQLRGNKLNMLLAGVRLVDPRRFAAVFGVPLMGCVTRKPFA